MRNIALLFMFLLVTNVASGQNEPEDYVKSFFSLIAEGKFTEAIENLPTNEKFNSDTSYTFKLLKRLEITTKTTGDYCGYELIEKEEISPSYVVYTYFIKYTNEPVRIQFMFYKPKDTWQVNNVSIAGQARQTAARRPGFRM